MLLLLGYSWALHISYKLYNFNECNAIIRNLNYTIYNILKYTLLNNILNDSFPFFIYYFKMAGKTTGWSKLLINIKLFTTIAHIVPNIYIIYLHYCLLIFCIFYIII